MNILSSKQFENRLAENSFSEISKYRILLTSQLIFWFFNLIGSSMNLGVKYIFLTIALKAAYLIIVFIGIKACYSINKRIDNTSFIERFILLFFPIGLKFILFATIIYISIWVVIQRVFILIGVSASIISDFNKFSPYFASLFMSSIFYFMLCRSFIRLEQKIKKLQIFGQKTCIYS